MGTGVATTYTSVIDGVPDTTAGTPLSSPTPATWASVRSGMVMASSGALAFRAYLDLTAPPNDTLPNAITVDNYQGIWKSPDGTVASTALVIRSGTTAVPGVAGALFDVLPVNPIINDAGQITSSSLLRINGSSVTSSNDTGVWSELGTGGLKLLLREGSTVSSSTIGSVAPDGWVTGGDNAAAFAVRLLPTGTALVKVAVSGTTVTPTFIANEGMTAPVQSGGTAGNFDNIAGNFSDPRMDSAGDIAFSATLDSGGVGIWYHTAAGGLTAIANNGQAAPGLGGPTFTNFERPSLSSDGSTIAFRAFVTGANAHTVYKGNPASPAGLVAIAKTNDTALPGIPVGSKLWSIWSPFTNKTGKVAFRVSMLDAISAETRASVADTNGTLGVIAKVGDTAPGFGAETFVNFDHPVIGDGNQVAFLAATSGDTPASPHVGLFRQAAGGGALSLVIKVGDVVPVSGGTDTIVAMTIPGSGTADRKYETKTMDVNGRILVHVTYASGKTGVFLTVP